MAPCKSGLLPEGLPCINNNIEIEKYRNRNRNLEIEVKLNEGFARSKIMLRFDRNAATNRETKISSL